MANVSSAVGKVVAPGDAVLALPEEGAVRIGPGLRATDTHIVAQKCGVVRQTRKQQLWLEGRQKRYIPAEEEVVVGVITDRHEDFRVDINAPFPALLPWNSFEGVTRKNRPPIFPGDVVYARVVSAYRDAEPVLSCVDSQGRTAGFGHLKAREGKTGTLFNVSSSYARALLQTSPPHPLLVALGRTLRYEVVVGLNGRVWVEGDNCKDVVRVMLVLQEGEFVSEGEAKGWVDRRLQELSDQMASVD